MNDGEVAYAALLELATDRLNEASTKLDRALEALTDAGTLVEDARVNVEEWISIVTKCAREFAAAKGANPQQNF